ncbi:hypothetical protein ACIRYZ_33865 [Kitasatospora sp. NPDC101155]|uniref:hypothetical protein n=1 Tax=Kitasatospora sp. NPDC101155 TaxID=3364097 RepID=UPI0038203836
MDLEQVLAAFPEIGYAARNILTLGRNWRAWTVPGRNASSALARSRVALVGETADPARPLKASGLHHALERAVGLGTSWDASGGDVRSWLAHYDARRAARAPEIPARCGAGHR